MNLSIQQQQPERPSSVPHWQNGFKGGCDKKFNDAASLKPFQTKCFELDQQQSIQTQFNLYSKPFVPQEINCNPLQRSNTHRTHEFAIQPPIIDISEALTAVPIVKQGSTSPRIAQVAQSQPTHDGFHQELVSYVKVEKHNPSRKNKQGQLIFWNEEKIGDYKYSKYLEQNRYNRLFVEKEMLGEGGFGQVFKVQHVLDQRMYAIKKIQIHLGINEDFKKHSVYREIVAIS